MLFITILIGYFSDVLHITIRYVEGFGTSSIALVINLIVCMYLFLLMLTIGLVFGLEAVCECFEDVIFMAVIHVVQKYTRQY